MDLRRTTRFITTSACSFLPFLICLESAQLCGIRKRVKTSKVVFSERTQTEMCVKNRKVFLWNDCFQTGFQSEKLPPLLKGTGQCFESTKETSVSWGSWTLNWETYFTRRTSASSSWPSEMFCIGFLNEADCLWFSPEDVSRFLSLFHSLARLLEQQMRSWFQLILFFCHLSEANTISRPIQTYFTRWRIRTLENILGYFLPRSWVETFGSFFGYFSSV